MLIVGVDPGSQRTGFGAIETDGRRHRLVEAATFSVPERWPLPQRLHRLHEEIASRLQRLRPQLLAVEDLFHAANARSALVLGHVRGVVLLAGAQCGVPIEAFPPATVKLQVAGSGRADKTQVAFMVARQLALSGRGEAGDTYDALAVALCAGALACSGLAGAAPPRPADSRRRAGRP